MNIRAPKEHGEIVAAPPLEQVADVLQQNRQQFADTAPPILGRSLPELRALARREILDASKQYHKQASEPVPDMLSDRWIVAGHQPELFHPGVWFKNFASHQLARRHSAVSLNLIVDTDNAKPPTVHFPAGDRLARVPFDRVSRDAPYEERVVADESIFADFPGRAYEHTRQWDFAPLLPEFWAEVMRHAARTPLLGERFAAARRTFERRWGCVQREAPMSLVCQTEAFAWFACSILQQLESFHATYNQVVRAYRTANRIRSRNHPVPDLTAEGAWLEAPFWAWRTGQTQRDRLFIRSTRDALTLRIGNSDGPTLPLGSAQLLVDAWRELESLGFKVRSRALTTTLFARLFLADLFVHGIGGGMYDQLTDRIIESYYERPAPGYLVLSATLLLPLRRYPDAVDRQARGKQRLRELTYKPERFIGRDDRTAPLLDDKRSWIARVGASHAERAERFTQIRTLNAELRPFVATDVERVRLELAEAERQVALDEIARRRDYAFCLYPESLLRTLGV